MKRDIYKKAGNVEMTLERTLTNPLSGTCPKDMSSYHKYTYSTIFTAALFIITRNWKQPRCP